MTSWKAYIKGVARRQRDIWLPRRETRGYRSWIANRVEERRREFTGNLEPGLLSIITPVWNGSPVQYLRELAESVAHQMDGDAAEWFLLDNGCVDAHLRGYLDRLRRLPFVTVHRSETNLGIARGLRICLEHARGRYVLPVDADDHLYSDALQVITTHIQRSAYPALLYTDEDKISARGVSQPYFKPDWDPVLLSNSAYIAHLGVIDRAVALSLDAYSDAAVEGSVDWDLFVRFANAGYAPVHIPEIVYSWRVHAQSTSDDAGAKPYIQDSQKAVMQRFLNAQPNGSRFRIAHSALFGPGSAHFRFERLGAPSRPAVLCRPQSLADILGAAAPLAQQAGVLCINFGVEAVNPDWMNEALGTLELFPDSVMVGGRISNHSGELVEGANVFGFGSVCQSPDAGRKLTDPGYFGQVWKIRSTNAVSARLCAVDAGFLCRALRTLPPQASLPYLGCWLSAEAARERLRVIYNPFLHGVGEALPPMLQTEGGAFLHQHADLIADQRYYPKPFSMLTGYKISKIGQ